MSSETFRFVFELLAVVDIPRLGYAWDGKCAIRFAPVCAETGFYGYMKSGANQAQIRSKCLILRWQSIVSVNPISQIQDQRRSTQTQVIDSGMIGG